MAIATIPVTFVAFPVTLPVTFPVTLPVTLPVTSPVNGPENPVAVIAPAAIFPVASLKTMVFGVFNAVAEVALLLTFPAVAMVANLVSAIAAVAETSASTISPSKILALVTALAAMVGKAAVPVKSPANCTFPFTVVVASGIVAAATAAST